MATQTFSNTTNPIDRNTPSDLDADELALKNKFKLDTIFNLNDYKQKLEPYLNIDT